MERREALLKSLAGLDKLLEQHNPFKARELLRDKRLRSPTAIFDFLYPEYEADKKQIEFADKLDGIRQQMAETYNKEFGRLPDAKEFGKTSDLEDYIKKQKSLLKPLRKKKENKNGQD